MADSTIGNLDLNEAIYDDLTLIPVEHNGVAMHITARQLKKYIEAAAREAAFGLASDGGKLIVGPKNYGTELPEEVTEGHVFFLLG